MKIKEIKHDHTLTDLLKVLLFSILMLAPILAIGVKCAYVVINKNANQSYSGKNTEEMTTTIITNIDDLRVNNTYIFDTYDMTINSSSNLGAWANYMNVNNLKVINFVVGLTQPQENVKSVGIYYNTSYGTKPQIQFTFNDDRTQIMNQTNYVRFSFEYVSNNFNVNWAQYNCFYSVVYNDNYYLDNVFYYAIDEVAQEPLFNWTQNTAIYTGVNAMCTGMEITSPIIPILITYWFLLTCIYVIIDILIKGFTMLTHLIGSKLA